MEKRGKKVKCPNCKNDYCIKNGKVNGKQTYLCKECFSRFTLDRVRNRYPEKLKKEAYEMYLSGKSISEVARKLNIKVQTVHYWIKSYKERFSSRRNNL